MWYTCMHAGEALIHKSKWIFKHNVIWENICLTNDSSSRRLEIIEKILPYIQITNWICKSILLGECLQKYNKISIFAFLSKWNSNFANIFMLSSPLIEMSPNSTRATTCHAAVFRLSSFNIYIGFLLPSWAKGALFSYFFSIILFLFTF